MDSPYLRQPEGGTWFQLPNGQWAHAETGSVWPVPPSKVAEFGFIKTPEQVEDEILNADVIG